MTTNAVNQPQQQQLTFLLILVLGAIAALTPLAIDMYLPAMPEIARDLAVNPGLVQQTLAAYTAGFAIGQLIHGPISDSYGRRPVLIGGVSLFMVGAIVSAMAADITTLTYVRAAQGFCGAAAAVVIQALVRDMFDREEFARTMSFITLVMTVAPLAAPMIGGYLAVWFGWRSIFWLLAGFAALVIVLVMALIPETLPLTGRPPLRIGSTLRNYMKILRSRQSVGYIFASGFSFAGMFSFLTAGAFVYIDHYGVSTENFGYLFALNVVCLIVMTSFNGKFVRRIGSENMLKIGLTIQLLAGIALIVGQVLELGLWGTVIPVVFFVGTISIVGSNSMACVLSAYPELAGTASSLAGTLRFGTGTIVAGIVAAIHVDSAWPMTGAMAACAILSALFYWGLAKKIRK
ncbi:Bcr/CflA family drug resistance efflux transporter [Grimontia hollisae]|uniref:Bcr/CflA family efflux transporter n=2 Tax=Grimontia hollisae TaxID=673 RepID=D0IAL8_GRIHO|nr:Bcr/CflA family multidrug efflux MFS transporter [Grimontia hollisae]AMG31904.1 Bcr/CflA family drug resistance efflux transporter [Grimontia hollisae]EEY70936.1 putative multidrug resistance protein [Grimontia hollisae CIP 101886]MDF2186356.1 Bcr/CflA family multidrug efflux MFS transporter [Grimontia hollisae]STO44502.1 Sulfonamide resistance protein [Grimontia hollisae]STO57396.1 Sulfonamide resistance protein [Grimontia hollisae]